METSVRDLRDKEGDQRLSYLRHKLTGLMWVIGGCLSIHYTDFFVVIQEDSDVNQTLLTLAGVSFAGYVSVVMYSACVFSYEVGVVPVSLNCLAISAGYLSFFSSLAATWPVWGWLTLVYVGVIWGAFVNLGSFLPKGPVGGCLMVAALSLATRYKAASVD